MQADDSPTPSECSEPGHFLPVQRSRLLELLLDDPGLAGKPPGALRQLAKLLEAWYHREFLNTQEHIKEAYRHFDPEVSARWGASTREQRSAAATRLASELEELLLKANYKRIDVSDLDPKNLKQSLQKIALNIRLDDFEEIVLFRRGSCACEENIPTWFGLRSKQLEVPGYDRVCFFLRFKGAAYFEAAKRTNLPFEPGAISLKLFRNIPQVDLGTLFPNAEVRMRTVDRLLIGVPAAAGIQQFIFTKFGLTALASLGGALLFVLGLSQDEPDSKKLTTAGITLAVFGGFLLRKFNQFKNRKIYFLKVLSENLYYRNLDNDAGVFLHLLDSAEEAETKEALLAYAFLAASKEPITRSELDQRVERWLRKKLGVPVDFEVQDALDKLERLKLVKSQPDGCLSALPMAEGIQQLCSSFQERGNT